MISLGSTLCMKYYFELDVQGLASASRLILGALDVYAVHFVQHVTAYEVKV